ncbi:MAG: aminoacyl-histidine dipeptidase [bacterium]
MTFVSELPPKELWRHFDEILTIPRGSKNEQAIREYVIAVAEKNGRDYQQDGAGNVVVRKPATPGCENSAITILQSHLDMVNEKNSGVEHDFTTDPIRPRQEGDYLYATGTTLGSDNGIGVAAQLALLESVSVKHGPLELLFTVDEETGLTGASGLGPDLLKGRQLINLDTEDDSLYVGCAGGAGLNLTLPLSLQAASSGESALDIKLFGLRGGHSGVDIHLQRGNAVKLLARALNSVKRKNNFKLAGITGGNMHNAIPREAFATVLVASSENEAVEKALRDCVHAICEEFKPAEPDMQLSIVAGPSPEQVFTEAACSRVLDFLNALPHGVISMSYDIPGLVETSSNLASVKISDSAMLIHISNRSSVDSAIRAIQERVTSIALLAGADVEEVEGYPGWKPNLDSYVLKKAREVYQEKLGKEPEVKAVHAGLECGIIAEKYPGMDMVSLGPQIEFPHSPDERVHIGSVADFYELLTTVLEKLV